jgi:hypothetical protein
VRPIHHQTTKTDQMKAEILHTADTASSHQGSEEAHLSIFHTVKTMCNDTASRDNSSRSTKQSRLSDTLTQEVKVLILAGLL